MVLKRLFLFLFLNRTLCFTLLKKLLWDKDGLLRKFYFTLFHFSPILGIKITFRVFPGKIVEILY